MNGAQPDTWSTLAEAIEEWGYTTSTDDEGDTYIDGFIGEKIGQEEVLWDTLAPYVEAGSTLDIMGEDGETWRWHFDGQKCVQRSGKVVYE